MPRKWIRLISSDGFEFIVDYEAACISNVIKASLSSAGKGHLGLLNIAG